MKQFEVSFEGKATIYLIPDLGGGYKKFEVRDLKIWSNKFAQYKNAIFASFTRKRKSTTIKQTHSPSLVAFEGWNLPDLHSSKTESGLKIKRQRHTSFSKEWEKEFKEFYNNKLSEIDNHQIIDLRGYEVKERSVRSTDSSTSKDIQKRKYIAEEIPESKDIFEGSKQKISVNVYERNTEARKICIEEYGTNCSVCGINLEKKYGPIAKGFIHVHHLKPISSIGKEYKLDPIEDLRPVCPNCHSVIHLKEVPLTIDQAKELIKIAT